MHLQQFRFALVYLLELRVWLLMFLPWGARKWAATDANRFGVPKLFVELRNLRRAEKSEREIPDLERRLRGFLIAGKSEPRNRRENRKMNHRQSRKQRQNPDPLSARTDKGIRHPKILGRRKKTKPKSAAKATDVKGWSTRPLR